MRFLAITALIACASALPSAEPAPEPIPQAGAAAGVTPGTLASGPHKSGFWAEPTLPKHTIFAPIDLDKAGKLPVLIWGNGACSSNGTYFRRSLFEVASHGVCLPPPRTPNKDPTRKDMLIKENTAIVLRNSQRRPHRRRRPNNLRPPKSLPKMDLRKRRQREIRTSRRYPHRCRRSVLRRSGNL